jgi:uncharacterized OB-fold protein
MSAEAMPVPEPTPETRPYWEATTRHELVHLRCGACGLGTQHPRAICRCGSADLGWARCSGRARLDSYVIVHRPEPAFAAEAPFVLAVVELEEGVRMTTRIVEVVPEPVALPLDMPLELRWLSRGEFNLPVFAPAVPAVSP